MKNLISITFVFLAVNLFSQNTGTLTDTRDRQIYKWIRIGNQIWMAENLNYNSGRGSGKYGNHYGRVYDWKTAKTACPKGWHLPSDREWLVLEHYIGMSQSNKEDFEHYRRHDWNGGKQLKSRTGWEYYMQNGNGIDAYGFNALPGGYYQTYTEKFMWYGASIVFWTSSEANSKNAIARDLGSHYNGIDRSEIYKVHGAYCRCIKD